MSAEVAERPRRRAPPVPRLRSCAPHELLTRLGDKWSILAMHSLCRAPCNRLRFSELKDGIEGVSQRMLTVTLRHLERDGLVSRRVFPEVPPRVEYALTDLGRGMLPALAAFNGWIGANWPAIEGARRAYDARRRSA